MKIQRAPKDRSQRLRLSMQLAFLALNVWIGVQFFLWVRWLETSGATRAVSRPAGVDGWLPIAGLMNVKAWLATGVVPEIHPAAMFLLLAFVAIALLLKKAFCSWLCPVGTLSEYLWKLGQRAGGNFALPKWLDVVLRGLKYALLGFFVWAIVKMPAEAILEFMRAPYGITADIRMLNFFRFLSTTALVVIAVLLALSVVVKNFWCRYACPYGALLGVVSLLSPARIRRDADLCIDCNKCAKACPSRLPVDVRPQIRSAECTLCMSCVAACPVKDALAVKVTPKRALPAWAVAAAIATIFLGVAIGARVSGHWQSDVPVELYQYLVATMRH